MLILDHIVRSLNIRYFRIFVKPQRKLKRNVSFSANKDPGISESFFFVPYQRFQVNPPLPISPQPYNRFSDFLQSIGFDTPDAQCTIHRIQEVTPPALYQSLIFRANYFTFVLLKEGRSAYTLGDHRYLLLVQAASTSPSAGI